MLQSKRLHCQIGPDYRHSPDQDLVFDFRCWPESMWMLKSFRMLILASVASHHRLMGIYCLRKSRQKGVVPVIIYEEAVRR